MNRRVKLWHALVSIAVAVAGAYFGIPVAQKNESPPVEKTKPKAKAKPKVESDPLAAIGRIQFGQFGCTATVIEPRRIDGKYDILTAAHCTKDTPQTGTLTLRDGRKVAVRVRIRAEVSDCCWLETVEPVANLPTARLARSNPPVGTRVWHAGFGVDQPGNREDGSVEAEEDAGGKLRFRLSVSSGDSGGAILRTDTKEVVGAVCCTTAKGQVAKVWGCSAESAWRVRPGHQAEATVVPLPIPEFQEMR